MILHNLIILPFNIIEGLSLFLIYGLLFIKDPLWERRKLSLSIGYFLLLTVPGTLWGNSILTNAGIFGCLLLINLLCSRHIIYNLVMIIPAFFFYTLFAVFPEYMLHQITGYAPAFLLDEYAFTVPGIMVDLFLFALLLFTALKCKKQRLSLRLNGWEAGGFCLYFFFAIFEIYVLTIFEGNLTASARLISGSIVFLFSVILFLAYWSYLIVRRQKRQLEARMQETENYLSTQLRFLDMERENHEELRQLRHDLRSHLQIIQELCTRGDYYKAEKYTSELSARPELSRQFHMTGNQIADIVFCLKKEEAALQGTQFLWEGDFKALSQLDALDACTLLSNLLNNALEASAHTENGAITIQGIAHRNFYTLVIANRVNADVHIRNNHIATSKSDKRHHGIGLSSVMRIARKYHGSCTLSCEDNWFSVRVILPLPAASGAESRI